MAKYTKGEWKAYKDPLAQEAYAIDVKHRADEKAHQEIAVVFSEANARLIVAAPDLYEAVKAFLTIEYPPDISEILGEPFPEAHEMAQQALAKVDRGG